MRPVDLFAVQARVSPSLYADAARFEAAVESQAEAIAKRRERTPSGAFARPALAVWPENFGVFACLAGRAWAGRAKTVGGAMFRVALGELGPLVKTAVRHRARSLEEALLTTLAPEVFALVHRTFSRVAKAYGLWIVAGTAYLPRSTRPAREGFEPLDARVFNVALTYAPTGELVAETRKQNLVPTQEDVLHLSPGKPEDLPVVDTEFGKLATLICYDGFDEPHTRDEPGFRACGVLVDERGAEIVAQPSANAWPWNEPWVFNEPGESLLRREQWFDEGMFAQLRRCRHVRYVVNPQLVGEMFEHRFEAPSLILSRSPEGEVRVEARAVSIDREEIVTLTAE
ncbi:MAG: carbon-nitrogen hydrolase family protein [Myxococcales bacterium]|nr:carbon-nitrogen hydrolase family protein [Myxococcales bacterium]